MMKLGIDLRDKIMSLERELGLGQIPLRLPDSVEIRRDI